MLEDPKPNSPNTNTEQITYENFHAKFDEFLDNLIRTEIRKPLPQLLAEIKALEKNNNS